METAIIKLARIIREIIETLPATVVKFDQYVGENNFIGDFVEAFETADVIFIDIFVEGGAKRDVVPDAGNPFVDATFDLEMIC
jgi:hypothetical protein